MKKIIIVLLSLCMLFIIAGCKWNEQVEPTSVETHEETDENGNTYTVTYTYIDSTNGKKIDPSFYKIVIICGVVFSAMAAFFGFLLSEINNLKKRCTYPVQATVIQIRKRKNGNKYVRSKYFQYNATYRYYYNNISYESRNEFYGSSIFSYVNGLREGDAVTVQIDPADPNAVFDIYAKNLYNEYLYLLIFLGAAAAASFISYFVV